MSSIHVPVFKSIKGTCHYVLKRICHLSSMRTGYVGRPNITGQLGQNSNPDQLTGPFYLSSEGNGYTHTNTLYRQMALDLSRSNQIYGTSSTVQPKSVKFLACIKT